MALDWGKPNVQGVRGDDLIRKIIADDSCLVGVLITVREGLALVLTPEVLRTLTEGGAKVISLSLRSAADRLDEFVRARPQG